MNEHKHKCVWHLFYISVTCFIFAIISCYVIYILSHLYFKTTCIWKRCLKLSFADGKISSACLSEPKRKSKVYVCITFRFNQEKRAARSARSTTRNAQARSTRTRIICKWIIARESTEGAEEEREREGENALCRRKWFMDSACSLKPFCRRSYSGNARLDT